MLIITYGKSVQCDHRDGNRIGIQCSQTETHLQGLLKRGCLHFDCSHCFEEGSEIPVQYQLDCRKCKESMYCSKLDEEMRSRSDFKSLFSWAEW
jgi:hypothetical protein